MDTGGEVRVTTQGAGPLSHKIAVRGLREGDDVTEYGVRVGIVTADIEPGSYVHTH